MRKLMMVVALVVVLLPLAAVASLAATGQLIQCRNVLPCTGGSGDDKILERIGDGKDDVIVRGGATTGSWPTSTPQTPTWCGAAVAPIGST